MRSFVKHFSIRLKAVRTDPHLLGVMLLTGLSSLLYWPGLIDREGARLSTGSSELPISELLIALMWAYIWPMLAGNTAGGSIPGSSKENLALRPVPALPVSMRVRVMAEALLIVSFVFLVRIPSFIWGESIHSHLYLPGLLNPENMAAGPFVERSIMGTFIMLPAILCWVAPAQSAHFYFLIRPGVVVILLLISMVSGLFETQLLCVTTSLVISGVVMLSIGREFFIPRAWKMAKSPISARFRLGIDPEVRLRRDFWVKPLLPTFLFITAELLVIVLDVFDVFPELGFYFSSTLVFGFFFSFVALRPLGMYIVDAALIGKSGAFKNNDHHRNWVVLPVRREAMTRGIYLYGLIAGFLLWAGVVGVSVLDAWLTTGEARIVDLDGGSAAKYLLPHIALVPCIAGGLTSFAVGSISRGIFNIVLGGAVFIFHIALLVQKAPVWLHATVLSLLAIMGGVSALKFLRASRDNKDCCSEVF
ncbi:MAG: hypothetical protein ABIK28_03880 [Planctomycetota bacterium]